MSPKRKQPPDSVPPRSEPLPDDLRHDDQPAIAGDEIPSAGEDAEGDDDVEVHSPAIDGGVDQHPVHDDDPDDDFTPEDYEEQIEESDEAERDRRRRASADER
jgi:hypothetical protein